MANLRLRGILSSTSCLVMFGWGAPALAQADEPPVAETAAAQEGAIVVTARRRDEALQDVPIVVNVVTSETLQDLQVRQFTDVAQLVPGLTLNRTSLTASATLRGVNFDAFASGSNATVETYLNDTPLASVMLFQSLFDIGQIEVLRGPQGTLRGRASPSGSITVTTRRPSFEGIGATADLTASAIGNYNAQGAVNLPIMADVLAVRVAGFYDELGNRTRSVNSAAKPSERSWGGRVSALLEPTSNLTLNGMFQRIERRTKFFPQVESANLANPALPPSPVEIGPFNRLGVANDITFQPQEYTSWTWGAEWRFAGQKLNYVGGIHKSQLGPTSTTGGDPGNFFDASFPQPQLTAYGVRQITKNQQEAHEIRLSSDDRLFGFLDYVIGAIQMTNDSPTDRPIQTPVFLGPIAAANATTPVILNLSNVQRRGSSKEQSAFGSVTAHLGDRTELTGGLRYISYESQGSVFVNGVRNPAADEDNKEDATIFSGSLKHRFTDDLMAYASVGTSWRPSLTILGDFSLNQTPLERSFIFLDPETSTSYELGVKATLLDGRMRLNASYYHQDFKNYPYRPVAPVSFVSTDYNATLGREVESVLTGPSGFNFVAPVPAKVDGFELEAQFDASSRWNIGASVSYTDGRFNSAIPCNDYSPRDGAPDEAPITPSVAQIREATGGDNLSVCDVSLSTNQAPKWVGTLQSEYSYPIKDGFEAYLRGFATFYGDSANDPTNAIDDVPSYVLANAFLGIRDPDGAWDVSMFVRNLTDVKRVLMRSPSLLTTSYATLTGSKNGVTSYRTVAVNDPREFGLSLRMAFGSR